MAFKFGVPPPLGKPLPKMCYPKSRFFELRPILLAGLAVLLAIVSVRSQPGNEPTEAGLSAWLQQVRPEIEKTLGYPLPGLPRLELASAAQFRHALDADVSTHVQRRFPHLRGDALARALEDARAGSDAVAVARLVEGTNVILVRPENAQTMAAWDPALRTAGSDEFLKLIIMEETVRFALDRRHDLARLRSACRDTEEWYALQALVEGRCQDVARQLARQLGWQELFLLLAERYRHVPDVSADPGLRMTSQSVWQQRYQACQKGLAFFDHLKQQNISDPEKRLFSHRLRSMAAIEHAERYVRNLKSNRPDLAAVVSAMEKTPPPGDWTASRQALTPAMLISVANLAGMKDRAERVLGSWEDGSALVWAKKGNPNHQIAAGLLRFQSSSGARAYHEMALDLQRKQDELGGGLCGPSLCGPSLHVTESRSRPASLPGMDETVLWERKLQGPYAEQAVPFYTLLARRGDEVLEISWYGLPAGLDWAARIAAWSSDSGGEKRQ